MNNPSFAKISFINLQVSSLLLDRQLAYSARS